MRLWKEGLEDILKQPILRRVEFPVREVNKLSAGLSCVVDRIENTSFDQSQNLWLLPAMTRRRLGEASLRIDSTYRIENPGET